MRHPSSRVLFAYWDTARGERAAPDRNDIQPERIRHILGDVFILEIDPRGTLPFRVAGTRVCALFGRELRETSFLALWDDDSQNDLARLIDHVLSGSVGAVSGFRAETEAGRVIDGELLLLPLRHHGRTHSRVLGALTASGAVQWLGADSLATLSMTSLRVIDATPDSASGGMRQQGAQLHTTPRTPHLRLLQGGRDARGV